MTTTSAPSASSSAYPAVPATALDFLKYVDSSTDPFHAVSNASILLEASGFTKLKETDKWDDGRIKAGGRYYFTRNGSALVAFAVGGKFQPGIGGVHAVGAHTDSPCFKVRPVSKKEKAGYVQLGVETYGGGLWSTWFDRDLGLSGRVIVEEGKGKYTQKLVQIKRPILRIPSLAIHLDRSAGDGKKFDLENETIPMLGLKSSIEEQLSSVAKPEGEDGDGDSSHHSPVLLNLLAKELGVSPSQIRDFDLSLYDVNPSAIGGAHNEFIFAPRIDNLMSSFAAVTALLASVAPGRSTLEESSSVRAISLFDNEEVGSVSFQGANADTLPALVQRLSHITLGGGSSGAATVKGTGDGGDVSRSSSFLISSDVSHGKHPNFMDRYQSENSPSLGGGIVLKTMSNQRYATTSATAFPIRRWAELARTPVPVQHFSVKNSMPCGSTIGPMLSAKGFRTVDVGTACLSMHSVRETAHVRDPDHLVGLFESFWNHGEEVLGSLVVD